MLRLWEQEPEVEQLEHRHFLVLLVHEQAPLNGRAHLLRSVAQDGPLEDQGAQADGARR